MNSKQLAKHYPKLTPLERVALLTVAFARGDHAERDRLIRSAPKYCLHVPDCLPYVEALTDLAKDYVIQQLDAVQWYWRGAAILEGDKEPSERVGTALGLFAYLFTVRRQAWQRLCEEYQFDPFALVGASFGFETIEDVAELMASVACSAEEATAALQQSGEDTRAATIEEVFDAMRRAIEHRVARWE